jgi:hypothetical protein
MKNRAPHLSIIQDLISEADADQSSIRLLWQDIYRQTFDGTPPPEEEGSSDFSLPNLLHSVTTAHNTLLSALITGDDWFDLDSADPSDKRATILIKPLKKLINYYLNEGQFRHAFSHVITMSVLCYGELVVDFTRRRTLNPEYYSWKVKREISQDQSATLQSYQNATPESISDGMQSLNQNTSASIEGITLTTPPDKFLDIGCLRFRLPHFCHSWWSRFSTTIKDSPWRAYQLTYADFELHEAGELGIFNKSAVSRLLNQSSGNSYDIIHYFGPKFKKLPSGSIIAEDPHYYLVYCGNIILIEGEYPYIEISENKNPLISAIARTQPFKPHGATPGSYASNLAKWLDNNHRSSNDAVRASQQNVKLVDKNRILNQDQLQNLQNNTILEVSSGGLDNVMKIQSLTSGNENSTFPINEILNRGIINAMGTDGATQGSNLRSRTTSTEISYLQSSGRNATSSMAEELQSNCLLPLLQKVFCRVIQLGLPELTLNPELKPLFTEEEYEMLISIPQKEHYNILNLYYSLKLRAYRAKEEDSAKLEAIQSLIQVSSSNAEASSIINYRNLIEQYAKLLDITDLNLLNEAMSQYDIINFENALLNQGKMILPAETDDHELHLEGHVAGPNSPEAVTQHNQYHMQFLQALQQQTQEETSNEES